MYYSIIIIYIVTLEKVLASLLFVLLVDRGEGDRHDQRQRAGQAYICRGTSVASTPSSARAASTSGRTSPVSTLSGASIFRAVPAP